MSEEEIVYDHDKHVHCELTHCIVELAGKKYQVTYAPDWEFYVKFEMKA